MNPAARCPLCGAGGLAPLYEVRGVPVHDVLLMETRAQAEAYPRGDVVLGSCGACGFVTNTAFDPGRLEYGVAYEETQACSPRFNIFADELVRGLVERHGIRGRDVLEIGCGKGEFLVRLCEAGGNRGLGFDPAFVPGRLPPTGADVTFRRELYGPEHADLTADLVLCRHTLEHVGPVAEFLGTLRRALEGREDTLVFFEVPDTLRILRETAFWDVFYEHASYFTPGSLARLFRRSGFELVDLDLAFDGQYVLLAARASAAPGPPSLPLEDDLAETRALCGRFRDEAARTVRGWRARLDAWRAAGESVALWAAGSKAVAFLTTTAVAADDPHVAAVVDLNPAKHGRFLPGSGHLVTPPSSLGALRPDHVIAMNPVYREEIRADLGAMGLAPELLALGADDPARVR